MAERVWLALPDLNPPGGELLLLPRLPTLERLIARATPAGDQADWRAWLAEAWLGPVQRAPVGATIAAAAGLAAHAGDWLVATPVQLVALPDRLRLHRSGPVALSPEQARELVAAHALAFADTPFTLVLAGHTLLVRVARHLDLACQDPFYYTGADVAAALPAGGDAPCVARYMTELQMWLHGRPWSDRTRLKPNALWLWGAGAGPVPRPCARPRLESDDAYLNALDALAAGGPGGARVVTVRLAALGEGREAFAHAEAHCLAPLARALARGAVGRLSIWFAARRFECRPWHVLRAGRRARPWWSGAP